MAFKMKGHALPGVKQKSKGSPMTLKGLFGGRNRESGEAAAGLGSLFGGGGEGGEMGGIGSLFGGRRRGGDTSHEGQETKNKEILHHGGQNIDLMQKQEKKLPVKSTWNGKENVKQKTLLLN